MIHLLLIYLHTRYAHLEHNITQGDDVVFHNMELTTLRQCRFLTLVYTHCSIHVDTPDFFLAVTVIIPRFPVTPNRGGRELTCEIWQVVGSVRVEELASVTCVPNP